MEKVYEALSKWHAQEKQLKYLDARTKILKDELIKISNERNKIYDEKYKYSDIAVTEHQYWANDDFTMIVRIGDLNRTGPGIEFFVSTKGKKDNKYYSSSIGILNHGDTPITKEQYETLYNAM